MGDQQAITEMFKTICFLKKDLILFQRQSNSKRESKKSNVSSASSLSKAVMIWTGPGQSQKTRASSRSHASEGPKDRGHSLELSQAH